MPIEKISANQDNFEQAFFNLAYAKLQDKLRNILPYMVGFEVVDGTKSEDGSRAIGIFGFKGNNEQILFVPVFFLNGEVKSIDLLYSKNNEQFVPLNEDFAQLFLSSNENIGEPSKENASQLRRDMPSMDFRNMVMPPRTGKYSIASVVDYVKSSNNFVKKAFQDMIDRYPDYAESLARYYSIDKVAEALVPLGKKYRKETDVQVIKGMGNELAKDLSSDKKQDLATKGYTIVDNRPDSKKSKWGKFQYVETFTNPSENGIVNYVTADGTLNMGMVFINPLLFRHGSSSSDAIVVDLSNKNNLNFYAKPSQQVLIKDQIKVDDYSKIHNMLGELSEVTPSFDKHYILVNENLQASAPFSVRENYLDANKVRRIVVDQSSYHDSVDNRISGDWSRDNSFFKDQRRHNSENGLTKYGSFTLVLTKKIGNKLEFRHPFVYVPKGFKVLEVNRRFDKEGKKEPGQRNDLIAALRANHVFPMTVRTNGSEYYVKVDMVSKKFENPIEAKIAMVTSLGMDEKQAEQLIESLIPDIEVKGYLKKADIGDRTLPLIDEQPQTNQLGQPEYYGVPYQQVLEDEHGYQNDPTRLGLGTRPDVDIDAAVDQASQMASNGQKEIFDAQSIATLSKYVSPADKIGEFMPDLVNCLDKLGRLIFLFNWESEKFVQLYGSADLPEFQELIRATFRNLGDTVVFLKKRSPELSINSPGADIAQSV